MKHGGPGRWAGACISQREAVRPGDRSDGTDVRDRERELQHQAQPHDTLMRNAPRNRRARSEARSSRRAFSRGRIYCRSRWRGEAGRRAERGEFEPRAGIFPRARSRDEGPDLGSSRRLDGRGDAHPLLAGEDPSATSGTCTWKGLPRMCSPRTVSESVYLRHNNDSIGATTTAPPQQ